MEWTCTGQLVHAVEPEVGFEPTTDGEISTSTATPHFLIYLTPY